jgi:hypothetical protein
VSGLIESRFSVKGGVGACRYRIGVEDISGLKINFLRVPSILMGRLYLLVILCFFGITGGL